jgi:polysaccharide deacetylase family protein (PEP-CTERM system associated)
MPLSNALTVDVEDYYHVSAFEPIVERARWGQYESRVVRNTERLLDLFDKHQVKATFFILGWVAERHPELVQEIDRQGHEIGSHSYWHRLIYDLTPDEFRTDLRQSRDAIEAVIGRRITAYRAPSFSITQQSLWALDILVSEGFEVDSSIFPIHHDRYGIPDAKQHIHQITTAGGNLWEFPASVRRFAGVNWPISGGGYFRLYPLGWTIRGLARLNESLQRPFMFYVHPWEIDEAQPRIPIKNRLSRFRHYVNLSTTFQKLDSLLTRFQFGTMDAVIQQSQGHTASTV